MRPTKARHLSPRPVSNPPVIARHRKTFKTYTPQRQAGTMPVKSDELGCTYKGRAEAGR